MHIVRAFFQSYVEKLNESGQKALQIENYMADPNDFQSKLAANCSVALAKAYCAGASIEAAGDDMYNGGLSLPVKRQVAQLLYGIPHYHRAIQDSAEGEKKEVFKLTTDMTMEKAEDLASSITSLTEGKIEINV